MTGKNGREAPQASRDGEERERKKETKRYLRNEWQLRVITSNSTRTYETLVCGVPSEELREKHGVGPKLHLFLGAEFVELDLFGRKV